MPQTVIKCCILYGTETGEAILLDPHPQLNQHQILTTSRRSPLPYTKYRPLRSLTHYRVVSEAMA